MLTLHHEYISGLMYIETENELRFPFSSSNATLNFTTSPTVT